MTAPELTIILVAGPSGSGKSRLSAQTGVPQLRLDDFYHDHDHPGLPRTTLPGGVEIIDWDDVASWDAQAAVSALAELARTGRTNVPDYDISTSSTLGHNEFVLPANTSALICEGIFAVDLARPCREAGLRVESIWLDRPRWFNFARRLQRDLRQRRKSPGVLVRRGLALVQAEPAMRRVALGRGFTPLGMRAAAAKVRHLAGQTPS